jgi:cation-transporting ATPase E
MTTELRTFETGADGLTSGQVAERVASGRANTVPVQSSRSLAAIVRANVFTWFNGLIGALFVIMLVVAPIQDALFGFVIIFNALIGIVQELRAKRTLDSLAIVGEARPRVRRDGAQTQVASAELVQDDLVLLAAGDKIPVDGVVVEAEALEVDESLLTGEADPVAKREGDELLSGSFAVAGSGAMRATRVGADAHAAKLAAEAQQFTLVRSELRDGINRILRYLTVLMIPAAILQVVVQSQVSKDEGTRESISRTIAGIVPMVPEGLVLLTSVAFAVGVVRLGRKQCLVQELPAIEGLARVDMVCLDKTGTLTEGGMRLAEVKPVLAPVPVPEGNAVHLSETSGTADASDSSAIPDYLVRPSETSDTADASDAVRFSETSGIADASDSSAAADYSVRLSETSGGSSGDVSRVREILGALGAAETRPNATMAAVIESCPDPGGWRAETVAAFSSARKWSGVTFAEGRGTWLFGAPDVLGQGTEAAVEAERLGGSGLRVLMLASYDGSLADDSDGANRADAGLSGRVTPVALVMLEQRIRDDAAPTLGYFERQDVALKVISGDNAVSVGAVAGSLGLPGADDPLDARTLPSDPDALAEAVSSHSVFGRVTPRQKQQMVAALQSRGHTVAMTGDGVNDVLALKSADIGVAMGSGSGAARAVAQIVLLDERFATLPSVVAEGRRVVGNIERVSNLFLVKSFESFLMVLLVGIARLPYPFLPRHTTLISTLTIGTPAFFLALAPNTARARTGFVGRVLSFAIPAGLIAGAASFTSYYLARLEPGARLEVEQTAAMVTLFTVGLWVLTLVARPLVWWKLVLIAAMACGFLLVALVPVGRRIFDLHFGAWQQTLTSLAVAGCAAVTLELLWRLDRRREARAAAMAATATSTGP